MKSAIHLFSMITFLFLFSCDKMNLDSEKAQDQLELDKMLQKITAMANSVECNNSNDWNFIALGEKACGGPKGYIAYSKTVIKDGFEDLVKEYNEADIAFNKKYKLISDCMLLLPPSMITCKDGKAELIYKY